jgi:hypothetical protein
MGKQADVVSIIQVLKRFCKVPAYASSFTIQDGSQDLIQYHQEQRWNDTDREKLQNSEKNLSKCIVHHKSHMD